MPAMMVAAPAVRWPQSHRTRAVVGTALAFGRSQPEHDWAPPMNIATAPHLACCVAKWKLSPANWYTSTSMSASNESVSAQTTRDVCADIQVGKLEAVLLARLRKRATAAASGKKSPNAKHAKRPCILISACRARNSKSPPAKSGRLNCEGGAMPMSKSMSGSAIAGGDSSTTFVTRVGARAVGIAAAAGGEIGMSGIHLGEVVAGAAIRMGTAGDGGADGGKNGGESAGAGDPILMLSLMALLGSGSARINVVLKCKKLPCVAVAAVTSKVTVLPWAGAAQSNLCCTS
eukprot:6177770-Pleurochrysis_carterae.AAC.2